MGPEVSELTRLHCKFIKQSGTSVVRVVQQLRPNCRFMIQQRHVRNIMALISYHWSINCHSSFPLFFLLEVGVVVMDPWVGFLDTVSDLPQISCVKPGTVYNSPTAQGNFKEQWGAYIQTEGGGLNIKNIYCFLGVTDSFLWEKFKHWC